MRFAKVLVLVVVSGATALAQIHDLSRIPTVSPVPHEFVGIWDWKTPRQSCGTVRLLRPAGDVRQQTRRCVRSVSGRSIDWRKCSTAAAAPGGQFTRNGGDDVISPRWTCVAAGLGTVLTESYHERSTSVPIP